MPSRPTHFEIPVDNPDRAEAFYKNVFGWSFNHYEGAPTYYGLAGTGDSTPGIDGALFQRDADSVTTLTMSVDSIEDALSTIESNGGTVLQGKTAVPGIGWFATCEDTEHNKFGLFTNDTSAA